MPAQPFPDRPRADALEKVKGTAAYAADVRFPGLLHAMTVPSPVVRGRVAALDTEAALRVPGVLRILTPADFPPAPQAVDMPGSPRPGLVTQVAFRGEPLVVVIAETLEAAIEGAEAVRIRVETEPFSAMMDSPGGVREPARDVTVGDAARTLGGAAMVVEASYESPTQHHNPIELLSTTAVWADGRLLIHEGSQNAGAIKVAVARTLGLDPAIVDVKSPTVGGAFGQKGWVQRQTALVARAAMLTGRPVKLVTPRGQIFHLATFRPHSRHRIRLGADASGIMTAVHYEVEQQNSRSGGFPAGQYHEGAMRLYGIANYHGAAANIRTDTQAPGHMRAPYEHPACFAFESAVDELSYQLGRDPVAFRMANDTRIDVHNGRPLSSRFLNDCLRIGAERFGWSRRRAEPGSMTDADGTQIGWGVACGLYPTLIHPAIATLRIRADGGTRFAVAGHEFGQGIRTALAAVLTRELQIDDRRLEVLIGDTTAAPQHLTAGSWGSASALPLAVQAVKRMRLAVAELLNGRRVAGTLHQQIAAVRRPFVEVEVSQLGPGQDASALERMRAGGYAVTGPAYPSFTTMSYIAHFVEVRVEPRTRRVRVPRVVSIADCGRVISPRTAASQVRGGVVWGVSHALREATEIDPRYGGFLNNDLAEYVVAVNADIGDIEVGFIDEPDPLFNSIGLKSLGEVAMVGVSAAVANAIFHATGKRVRKLPIRIEHLL
ncbi:xanthine dehydrogenase family protein molybdopterin-binding subunit [Teichococcus vastitatis]|uniref:Xanthine dehydrogenase family protein molybdopterin-binding subunit n=1 Tax=Teichococcus vastitatis TaxID=2307076 RepID=A0ABS9W8H1_9PROT|nr:xanthine dehydrogenase family protein molybdopterin-binding subunit [Pseudoroseomonas vastitatis]MCI0755586.1 xanthine dehydrogenase family protein molybdopterin-binding subunit [Pseudoroseomonas vastitatis]